MAAPKKSAANLSSVGPPVPKGSASRYAASKRDRAPKAQADAPKKADAPSPAKVAKLRRDGATWQGVRDALGVRTSSGAFTKALNEAGYGPDGLKLDGSGPRESKARVKGSTQPAKADALDAGKEG